MTNKRLDDALSSIEAALDELTKAVADSQKAHADALANAPANTDNEAVLSQEEMAQMRGELADAMDIVRQLQSVDSLPANKADGEHDAQ